jgi:hypothetical protein
MDIHPPHHPINSVRDFLLQIFTVTCGIVIALALEGVVVGWHDTRLLRATRQDFAAEIGENAAKVEQVRAAATGDAAWIKGALAYGEARLKHQDTKPLQLIGGRTFPTLADSAWETAQATQAVRLMRFDEARAVAAAYNQQAEVNLISGQALNQWVGIAAYGDIADLSEPEMREGMRQLRVAYAYTVSLRFMEEKLLEEYRAAQRAIANGEGQ